MLRSRILSAAGGPDCSPFPWRPPGQGPAAEVRTPARPRRPEPAQPAEQAGVADAALQERVNQAYQRGYREGEASGRKSATVQLQSQLEELGRTIVALAELRPKLCREAETDLLRLAVAIAGRVLRRETTLDPTALQGIVAAALSRLQGQQVSAVRVHPDQTAALSAILRRLAPTQTIEVTGDARLAPGGLVFETDRGRLDASLQTQLDEIERGLVDRIQRSR